MLSSARERGFNNSKLLAAVVAEKIGVPLVKNALRCTRDGTKQKHLKAAEREENVKGLFVANERLDGLSLLLIDDVCTTGSTLRECALILRDNGASDVKCAVLASTELLMDWSENR